MRLSKTVSDSIRCAVRDFRERQGLTNLEIDEALEKPVRFTDNLLNKDRELPARQAAELLRGLVVRFRDPRIETIEADLRRRIRGTNVAIPIVVPPLAIERIRESFERWAVAQGYEDATSWAARVATYLEEIRESGQWSFRQEARAAMRMRPRHIGEHEITPEILYDALLLACALTGAISSKPKKKAKKGTRKR